MAYMSYLYRVSHSSSYHWQSKAGSRCCCLSSVSAAASAKPQSLYQPMPMPEQTAAPELQPLLIARAFIKLIAHQHAAAATI